MTIEFDQAKQKILDDPGFSPLGPQWGDAEFAELKAATGCTPPAQLEKILREIGSFALGWDNAVLGVFDQGQVVKTEVQIAMAQLKTMVSDFRSLRMSTEFPDRFPLDMIFFGSAEAGHAKFVMHSAEMDDGAVYLWPITGESWGTPGNPGLAKVTDTLFEFYYHMTEYDNI
ncbi:MAG: hypothetical protein AB8B60_11860 [Sulfitobacter sp.]